MKLLAAMAMLGVLAAGTAVAADYSVGIVDLGKGVLGGGTAVNLYATEKSGVKLIETFVLQQDDFTGKPAAPLTLAINPAHNFVYVVYTGTNQPNMVGFEITSTGLKNKWEDEVETGDAGLQGSTFTAGPDYVIENTYPFDLGVHVVGQGGKELISDYEDSAIYISSGHVDSTRTFYYSCRATSPSLPASAPATPTSVSVYSFEHGVDIATGSATPVATSTDPVYIQSVCN